MADDSDDSVGGTLQPIDVIYCGKCGMPPEYCEYGPDYESHCAPWLARNHPSLHEKLQTERANAGKAVVDVSNKSAKPVVERPSEPWTTEQRLTEFYKKYQPEKLDSVPGLLEKYGGKEDKLFAALVQKYGPEPHDPYFTDSDESDEDDDDDDDEDEIQEGMEKLNVDGKKRRGKAAKKTAVVQTKVIIQKVARKKRKTTTIVIGMETIPGVKLKDVSKIFSKRFAGSSSVKDGVNGKEIIIQGDHMDDIADLIVSQFDIDGSTVFLDVEGSFVAYK